MATGGKDRILMASDSLYFLTFASGMTAFWISGQASALVPALKSPVLHVILGLAISGGIYGLGMFVLSSRVLHRVGKGTLFATITAVILGFAGAQIVVRLAAGHVHNTAGLGLLSFVLYLLYGTIYVASLSVGRRFAK